MYVSGTDCVVLHDSRRLTAGIESTPNTADLVIRRAALYGASTYQGRGYRTGMTLVQSGKECE
jgi:hypothetical protein